MTEPRSEGEVARVFAENFIRKYGRPKFLRLIELVLMNAPGPVLALEFQVTRQRVSQWKVKLGQERVSFYLHPEIESMLGVISPGRKSV